MHFHANPTLTLTLALTLTLTQAFLVTDGSAEVRATEEAVRGSPNLALALTLRPEYSQERARRRARLQG